MNGIKNKFVVVDTNVIVSGFFASKPSYPSTIIKAWQLKQINVAVSHDLLGEVSHVFQKPYFLKIIKSQSMASASVDVMWKKSKLVFPQRIKKVHFSDTTDHFLLELAVSAKA